MAFPPYKSTRYNRPYAHQPSNTTGKSTLRSNDDYVVTSYTNDHKVPPLRRQTHTPLGLSLIRTHTHLPLVLSLTYTSP